MSVAGVGLQEIGLTAKPWRKTELTRSVIQFAPIAFAFSNNPNNQTMSKKLKKYRVVESIFVAYEVEAENGVEARQKYSDYVGDNEQGHKRFMELVDEALCNSNGDTEAFEIDENGFETNS